MGAAVKVISIRAAKSAMATAVIGFRGEPEELGSVELRDHQAEGVERIMASLDKFGGAMLCDEVGLGKTFTAAAVIKRVGPAVVIVPAALRTMWQQALGKAGVVAPVVSLEQFSRLEPPACSARLVVIDEAHHLRNPGIRRFRNIALFAATAKVVLLSATPVHNSRRDLVSLLSLFLGSRASELNAEDIAICVIRRRRGAINSQRIPERINFDAPVPRPDERIRDMLLALPPPVPPRDGDDSSLLVRFTLLRQWASSDAALRDGLKARIARARVLGAALNAGRLPTRKEMSSWVTADFDVQLGFPELLAAPGGTEALRDTVVRHEIATSQMLSALDASQTSDQWRADYLRELRAKYCNRKIVAFTQFASTARALYRLLVRDGKVGLVTANRCAIASGVVSREDVLNRFAPRGTGSSYPPERENISLLIATDLCSEGLNLQDAGVVVHLDAPWTPARMEQRIGRIARTGSHHEEVFIHTIRTPTLAEDLLQIENRLRQKSLLAGELVGSTDEHASLISVPDANELLRRLLNSWVDQRSLQAMPVTACTSSARDCWIALVGNERESHIVCDTGNGISTDPHDLLVAARSLGDTSVKIDATTHRTIIRRIEEWVQQRSLAERLNLRTSPVRRGLNFEIDRFALTVPMHRRAESGQSLDYARGALAEVHSAGLELRMRDIRSRRPAGNELLHELTSIRSNRRNGKAESEDRSGFQLRVLLVGARR